MDNFLNNTNCDICQSWVMYCMTQPKEGEIQQKATHQSKKSEFWGSHKEHLLGEGFEYNSEMQKAIDFVEAEKFNDLSGTLLIVKVGNDEHPADDDEIKATQQLINNALDDILGVRAIIVHHFFNIEKINLPQLRNLESKVLSSNDEKIHTSIDAIEF